MSKEPPCNNKAQKSRAGIKIALARIKILSIFIPGYRGFLTIPGNPMFHPSRRHILSASDKIHQLASVEKRK